MRRGLYRRSRQGGRSQRTLLHSPFTSVADPRGLADPYGLGRVFGVPDFLWVAGDGNAPTIGPALALTGAPTVGASPWQLEDGTDVVSEVHTGASYRNTATVVDPAINEDIVVVVLFKSPPVPVAGNRIFATRNLLAPIGGFEIVVNTVSSLFARVTTAGGTGAAIGPASCPQNSLSIAFIFYDRVAATILLWTPIGATAPAAVPAGAITGSGIGVGSDPTGALNLAAGGAIILAGFFHGVGITPLWVADGYAMAEDFANRFTGLHPIAGDTPAFARNSAASWEDHNGIWHIASPGLPRAGDEDGLRAAPTRTNKCYNTINPQVTTGWATTGGTHTVPSDAAQLLTDGAQNWGPNVHQFMPGVGDQVIYGGALTANANAHSISVLMRGAAGGESVDIGVRDVSAGTVTNLGTVVLTTAWVRYIVNGFTPGDVDEQFCLDCDIGDTVLFIGSQLEEGPTATTPGPNYSTVAAAVRAAEVVTTEQALADVQGSIEVKLTPMNYTGLPGIVRILNRALAGSYTFYIASGAWSFYDGTSGVTSGTPTDGVENKIRTRWGPAGLSIDSDGTRDRDNYDGTLTGLGDLTVAPAAETQVKDLKVYRNGD